MGLAIVTFLSTFMLLASGGILLFNREKAPQMSNALTPGSQRGLYGALRRARSTVGSVVEHFEGVIPRTQTEVGVLQQRLIRAGFRGESAVKIFYGSKFVLMVMLCLLSVTTGLASLNWFFVIVLALAAGFLVPDFWLGRRITLRQRQIRRDLPDVLDLLVVCTEAGLSLDQATARTAGEMSRAKSAISDELGVVVLEQRAGCPRTDAWKHLSERTDVDSVRSVVSMLVQSEQFGTSIAKTLRVHSEGLRTQRIQQIEEQAAKTGIKILFPLVLCIFPNLFLVILGPAVMTMLDSLKQNFSH